MAFNNFEHVPEKPAALGVRSWDELCEIEQWGEGTTVGELRLISQNLQP